MIRFATPDDLPELTPWGEAFNAQSPVAGLELMEGGIEAYLRWHMESTTAAIIRSDKGMIGAVLQRPVDYVNALWARETFLWSGAPGDAFRLIKAAEEWADSRGAVRFQMEVLNNPAGDRLTGVLEGRMDYQTMQKSLTKAL